MTSHISWLSFPQLSDSDLLFLTGHFARLEDNLPDCLALTDFIVRDFSGLQFGNALAKDREEILLLDRLLISSMKAKREPAIPSLPVAWSRIYAMNNQDHLPPRGESVLSVVI
jgi:hypothetical protein